MLVVASGFWNFLKHLFINQFSTNNGVLMSKTAEEKKLRALLKSRKLEPYIQHIRFPFYKNLETDTRIDFTYPITALVGANGTNKSSVLRAIYGSPKNNNLGVYWFSTSVDPIEENGEGRNCFIYGYWNAQEDKTVEVLKTRIRKEDDPDYWEPSRPVAKYGMEEMPTISEGCDLPAGRSKTRWNTLDKSVAYLDFRADLSAYDKLFYHGELRNKHGSQKNKKDFIRARSAHLKVAIDSKCTSYEFYGIERVLGDENRDLTLEELAEVSTILGRSYMKISLIRHSFFNCDAYTSIMKVAGLNYSEAFAGSGEFAVVRLVVGVMTASEHSLILLDEPEVSLHPGAQERLMSFLAKMVKLRKHQIVISTHSPAIIRCLPPDAIKVFMMGQNGKVVIPSQNALPEEAFFYLGEPAHGRTTIVVEDSLAGEIVRRAIRLASEAISNLIDIRYFPGGSQTLWAHYIPTFSAENRSDVLVLLDGDCRPPIEIPDPNTIPQSDEAAIKKLIVDITGVDVDFKVDGGDGGSNAAQRNSLRRSYLNWARNYVDFLPGHSQPELFVWQNMLHDENSNSIDLAMGAKECFVLLTKMEFGLAAHESVNASDILATQRKRLATIPNDNSELIRLKDRLLSSIQSHSENNG